MLGCPTNLPEFNYSMDKIFPEEVDNIKSYMKDIFTTNINGFTENLSLTGSEQNFLNTQYNQPNNYSRGETYYNGKGNIDKSAYQTYSKCKNNKIYNNIRE